MKESQKENSLKKEQQVPVELREYLSKNYIDQRNVKGILPLPFFFPQFF